MKYLSLILSFCLLSQFLADAQMPEDPVLMTIGNEKVSLEEFERIYNKNNTAFNQQQSLDEYLEMFINFKLKVIEAKNLGMDTTLSFRTEFNSYRDQLAQPYLQDPEAVENLAREAYERMKTEVNASHILLRLDSRASSADTLAAYNKMMDIRARLLKGENFETVARATSEDPSVQSNGGQLGWFGVFMMVLPFEEAAYNTMPGNISMPFRTEYGYHIVKVNERRAARGNVQCAHIYLRAPESAGPQEAALAKQKAFAIYDSLKAGASFETLVLNNSDDRSTAAKGGELPWFRSGQMIKEFEDVAFALKNPGEYSAPVQSFYGWHIIKLLGKREIGSFEEEKPNIVHQYGNGPRGYLRNEAFTEKLKKEYNYKANKKVLETVYTLVDSSVFSNTWVRPYLPSKGTDVLFRIDGMNATIDDFTAYIVSRNETFAPFPLETFVNQLYDRFVADKLREFEKTQLERKYPEFSKILKEYHDGILLFDLTDKMVWSKAVQDTLGLQAFYEANKSNYKWEKRAEAFTITVSDSSMIPLAIKLAKKTVKKNKLTKETLASKLCPTDTTMSCVDVIPGKYEKGDNEEVDKTNWVTGAGKTVSKDGRYSFVYIKGVLPETIKKLDEDRGKIISDYQTHLETEWVKELRNKYPVQVDRDVLSLIK